ncbi:2343_t:CDS:2, partial [Funneliformis geosporum]
MTKTRIQHLYPLTGTITGRTLKKASPQSKCNGLYSLCRGLLIGWLVSRYVLGGLLLELDIRIKGVFLDFEGSGGILLQVSSEVCFYSGGGKFLLKFAQSIQVGTNSVRSQ